MAKMRALIVDDVVDMAETIANELQTFGFETDVADSGAGALAHFARDPADVVVTDLRMKAIDGLELLDGLKRTDPTVPVIVMTAFGAIETAVEAMRRGAFDYLTKPFQLDVLRSLVERACRERSQSRESATATPSLAEASSPRRLLGESTPMQQLRALIQRIATTSSPVLISGETGTGKELVARAIHAEGAWADKPFVAVNCAALPEPLLENELFGSPRGSFTGVNQGRKGIFAGAEGGTLFLDEVGELPLALQGKLLRALQSREQTRPVGSESAATDIRCIAATQKELSGLVQTGLFREDLFFRLDVLRVSVPPLRERRDDIPQLVEHFIARSRARSPLLMMGGLAAPALEHLKQHAWPGNVRQLENLVERLVVTVTSPLGDLADVERALGGNRDVDPIGDLAQRPVTLAALEEHYISAVLHKVGGSITKAAVILGVNPSTLYRRGRRSPATP